MEIPGADISLSASMNHTLVWNMLWSATDASDWLLQLALACCINTATDDQSVIRYFQHYSSRLISDKVSDLLANR